MFFFSNLFFTVCNEYFRPSSLASNWLFLHMHLTLNRWSFLLLLWEIKSHHLKLCWTCQPKSVSPPAATRNSLCLSCFLWIPPPFRNPAASYSLFYSHSYSFISVLSLPNPTPFPSCSLSLINLFRYVPTLSSTPLKPSLFSYLAAQILKAFLPSLSFSQSPLLPPWPLRVPFPFITPQTSSSMYCNSSIGPSWSWVPSGNTFTHTLQAPPLPWASSACFLFWTFTRIWPIKVGFKLHFLAACFLLPVSIFSTLANSHGFKYYISDNFQILVSCQDLPSKSGTVEPIVALPSPLLIQAYPRLSSLNGRHVFFISVNDLSRFLSQNPRHHLYLFSFKHNIQSFTT